MFEESHDVNKPKKMTQEELAEKIFVTGKAVSKWETGQGFPDFDKDFLQEVVGVFMAAHHAAHVPVQRLAVLPHHRVEL